MKFICKVCGYIHEGDAEMLPDGEKNAYTFFFGEDKTYRPAEKTLKDGDVLTLGEETITVVHTPGHTNGSVCFLLEDGHLLTGDTIFAMGYGRYDLYGGSLTTLLQSIGKLRALPQELIILPGHGEQATLGASLDVYF